MVRVLSVNQLHRPRNRGSDGNLCVKPLILDEEPRFLCTYGKGCNGKGCKASVDLSFYLRLG